MQSTQITKPGDRSGSGNAAHTVMTKANRCSTAIEMALAVTEPKPTISKTTIRSGNQTAAVVNSLSAAAVFSQPLGRETASSVVRLNYSVAEACIALGCGRSKLYDLIKTRQITPVKLGRRTLIPITSLESFVRCLATGQSSLVGENGK